MSRPSKRGTWAWCALVAASVIVLPGSFAGATPGGPAQIVSAESVGAFHYRDPLSRAVHVFGQPTSQRTVDRNFYCRTVWRSLGLTILSFGSCPRASMTIRVTVTGPVWRNMRGLRIGDSVGRLRSLYPLAHRGATHGTQTRWWVGLGHTLSARVARGQIVAFDVVWATTFTDTF
jgi:hypothetical protein